MRRRSWALVAVLVLLLPVAGIGIAVATLDPNDYKQRLVDAVEDATGRTLTIGGELTITRSLRPTVTATHVSLANLPGGTRADIAHAERITATLDLLALLHHRIALTDLTLVGPNILLEQPHDQPNWVFESDADLRGTAQQPSAWSLRIRQVHVQNGMVTFNLPPQPTRVIGIRALDLTHEQDGAPIDLASVLVYGDNKPFNLVVAARPTAGLDGPWNTSLHFAAFDSVADGTGTMSLKGPYDLHLTASSPKMEALNQLLPEMRLPALHGLALQTHLRSGPALGSMPVVGATTLRFAAADLSDRLAGLSLGPTEIALPALGGVATLGSGGTYRGHRFGLKGTVQAPADLDARTDMAIDLTAQDPTVGTLGVKGRMTVERLAYAGLNAAVSLQAASLAAVRPLLPAASAASVPALTGVAFHGQVALPADGAAARLSDVALKADQAELTGRATIGFGPAIALDATLHAAFLDADALLTAFGASFAIPANHGGPLFSTAPIAWSVLRGPSVVLAAEVDRLAVGGEDWRGLATQLSLKGGRLRIERLSAQSPAGPLSGTLMVDGIRAELALALPSVPFGWVTGMAGLPGAAQGTMRIDATLRGNPGSVHDFAATLNGSVSAAMGPGTIGDAALLQLTGASLEALGAHVPASGTAQIGCLGVASTIRLGVADLRTIAMASTYLTLEGSGSIDLGRETLDLHLLPVARVAGAPVQVPVTVTGPIRSPTGALNATGLDQVGFLLDGIFGAKDTPDVCRRSGLVR